MTVVISYQCYLITTITAGVVFFRSGVQLYTRASGHARLAGALR